MPQCESQRAATVRRSAQRKQYLYVGIVVLLLPTLSSLAFVSAVAVAAGDFPTRLQPSAGCRQNDNSMSGSYKREGRQKKTVDR